VDVYQIVDVKNNESEVWRFVC